jgi:hypothetical protein
LNSPGYNISPTIANLNIAEMCLAYIIDNSPNITTEDSSKLFLVFDYADENWADHYLAAGDAAIDSTAEALLMCFLTEDAYIKNYFLSRQDKDSEIDNNILAWGDPVYITSRTGPLGS